MALSLLNRHVSEVIFLIMKLVYYLCYSLFIHWLYLFFKSICVGGSIFYSVAAVSRISDQTLCGEWALFFFLKIQWKMVYYFEWGYWFTRNVFLGHTNSYWRGSTWYRKEWVCCSSQRHWCKGDAYDYSSTFF